VQKPVVANVMFAKKYLLSKGPNTDVSEKLHSFICKMLFAVTI